MPLTRVLLDKANLTNMITMKGALTVYQDEAGPEKDRLEWDIKQARGITCEFVDASKIRMMEPVLENIGCGVFTPEWFNITNPYRLTLGLVEHLTALGGKICREQIKSIEIKDQRAISAKTSSGNYITFDSFFICAGIWSKSLCHNIGERVIIESERGYNTTLPNPGIELSRQIIFGDHKFVMTPIDGGLRIGGAAEFAGIETAPNYTRSKHLMEIAMRYLPELNTEGKTQWMGHRPSTPDSIYFLARITASSIPNPAIRLSKRAITINTSVTRASRPRTIFRENTSGFSKVCIAEASRLFRLGNILSSIITADTPKRSKSRTKYSNCTSDPPVSPSTIIGLDVTLRISSIVCNLDGFPTISASGRPFDAESVKLLSQNPS